MSVFLKEQPYLFQNWVRWQWIFLWETDLACPEEHATEIWSDSDHSTKVESTTISPIKNNYGQHGSYKVMDSRLNLGWRKLE